MSTDRLCHFMRDGSRTAACGLAASKAFMLPGHGAVEWCNRFAARARREGWLGGFFDHLEDLVHGCHPCEQDFQKAKFEELVR